MSNIKNKKYWEIKNQTKSKADLYIYSAISNWSDCNSLTIRDEIDSLGDISELNIFINSPGGDVFEGIAIANFLKRKNFKKNVYIDALCASISTVIALGCGGAVYMYENSLLMIHKAWSCMSGNADDFRKIADDLEMCDKNILSTYLDRINDTITEDELVEMMKNETWLDANKCLEIGFIDDIIKEDSKAVASLDSDFFNIYNNIPEKLKIEDNSKSEKIEMSDEVKRIIEEADRVLKANS